MRFRDNPSITSLFAVAAVMAFSVPAHAQERSFDLSAQSASDGIRAFARQANIEVLVGGDAVQGRTTNAVRGNVDIRVALDRLLSGTGLAVRSFDGKVAILGAPSAQAETDDGDDGIVVTGSRIARPELESAMPISVVNMEEAESLGMSTIYEALQREPAIGVGDGPESEATASQGFDNGTATVDLRRMGANRTLTLVDGRRRVSGSARSSAVDLNMIPAGMIERIEVITGGAAAIYGADAVTGAVNVITKRDIEGGTLNATVGISDKGDAGKFSISGSIGTKFADDRGSIAIGGTYTKSDPLFTQDRKATRTRVLYVADPASVSAKDGIPDQKIYYDIKNIYYMLQPTFYVGGNSYIIEENGIPRLGGYDVLLTPNNLTSGGDGGDGANLWADRQLRAPRDNFAITSRFDYALTDSINLESSVDFGRSKYNGTRTYYRDDSRTAFLNGAGGPTARLDNPYLPDGVRDFMLDTNRTTLRINRAYGQFGIIREYHDRSSYTLQFGLNGQLSPRVNWEAFYQYGRTADDVTITNNPIASHLIAARDVISDPVTGAPVCRDATARANGCLPFNMFGQEELTAAERAYLLHDRRERRVATQSVFGASMVAKLLPLPAGDVALALGLEHRKETLDTVDDPLSLNGEVSHSGTGYLVHPNLSAAFDVSEVYGELVVPILKDVRFADRLSIEGAYRYSEYSSIGNTEAWKVAGIWAPVDWLAFRAVRSRSVRAPNFGELYEEQSVRSSALDDPCEIGRFDASATRARNCRALGFDGPAPHNGETAWVTYGGNPDLRPETSNSLTVGMVFQPKFLRGLEVTTDYWDIKIDDMITQFSANQVARLCFSQPTLDNDFCRQLSFDPDTHYIIAASSQQINASSSRTRGIDVSVNYRMRLGSGSLRVGAKGTYLLQKDTITVPGDAESGPSGILRDDGEYRNPTFKATVFASYNIGPVNVASDIRYISKSAYSQTAGPEYYEDNSIPARIYSDISLRYKVSDAMSLTLGVNNVFDVKPPYMPDTYLGLGNYDIVGRYLFTSIKSKF